MIWGWWKSTISRTVRTKAGCRAPRQFQRRIDIGSVIGGCFGFFFSSGLALLPGLGNISVLWRSFSIPLSTSWWTFWSIVPSYLGSAATVCTLYFSCESRVVCLLSGLQGFPSPNRGLIVGGISPACAALRVENLAPVAQVAAIEEGVGHSKVGLLEHWPTTSGEPLSWWYGSSKSPRVRISVRALVRGSCRRPRESKGEFSLPLSRGAREDLRWSRLNLFVSGFAAWKLPSFLPSSYSFYWI